MMFQLSWLEHTSILMDKSWINMSRNIPKYMEDLNKLLDFAFANNGVRGKIICPCLKCNFNKW